MAGGNIGSQGLAGGNGWWPGIREELMGCSTPLLLGEENRHELIGQTSTQHTAHTAHARTHTRHTQPQTTDHLNFRGTPVHRPGRSPTGRASITSATVPRSGIACPHDVNARSKLHLVSSVDFCVVFNMWVVHWAGGGEKGIDDKIDLPRGTAPNEDVGVDV